ncbi:MAG: helix-turn-helix domain-containing protein, partial [Pseudomonadota bacterium]
NINRSPRALITGALLLTGLSFLQLGHLGFINGNGDPLGSTNYLFWLFMTPPMFYLFCRAILFGDARFTPSALIHLAPVLLILIPRTEIAISLLFCVGTGYSLWLTHVIYTLRKTRQRFRFELFFLSLFTVLAIGVLVLGFSLPYMDPAFFYYAYAFAIGLAIVLVVATLLSFPELLSELAEAAKLSYASSTLQDVNVVERKRQLDELMYQDKLFKQESLNLSTVAEAIELSAHQLSELVNTEYKMSFSRFVREHRVREAEQLLAQEPNVSILAISMEVGFKSQSNFYAAFKEITGRSPGSYRNA